MSDAEELRSRGDHMKHYPRKHYAIDQWVDFTRGVVAGDEAAQMREHLRNGCVECSRLSDFTGKVSGACVGLATAQVPESALRLARAIFPIRMVERPKRGNRLPVEMIFDSFLVPSAAGLRSTWQIGWQGLYRAGDCSVDLRIEPELKSSRAAVIGQITSHVQPAVEMGNLPVCLRAGKQVVAETVSNRFGEFQMEFDQQTQLKLCISLRDAKSIQVPLRKFTSDQPAAKSRSTVRKRSEQQ
jgi:hypothetical protein